MKNYKRILAFVLTLTMIAAFAGCGSGDSGKKTIGIIQFGSHASLNNCYDGIMKGLEENGITEEEYNIEYVNSNFDASVSQTQANNFVNKNAAVIIAIATPSAVAAANAAEENGVPVVYCAVTDATVMENYSNVTGSSDIPNFEKQLDESEYAVRRKPVFRGKHGHRIKGPVEQTVAVNENEFVHAAIVACFAHFCKKNKKITCFF